MIELAELPVLNWFMRPVYRSMFLRNRWLNLYSGVFDSFAAAQASAPPARAVGYDNAASAGLYRERIRALRASDFPSLFWMQRLIQGGARRVFDLGGHFGISYYALALRSELPSDLDWCVYDVPAVVTSGREYAAQHDADGRLRFTGDRQGADGADVLLASGALQYLDYSLAELLRTLSRPPRELVICQTPLHPSLSFFTLQSMGTAFCPYRVSAEPRFVAELAELGYHVVDRWESLEKRCRIPFRPGYSLDRYTGLVLRRAVGD